MHGEEEGNEGGGGSACDNWTDGHVYSIDGCNADVGKDPRMPPGRARGVIAAMPECPESRRVGIHVYLDRPAESLRR